MQLFFSLVSKLLFTWAASGWHQTITERKRETQSEPGCLLQYPLSATCLITAEAQHTSTCANKHTLAVHTSYIMLTPACSGHHVNSNKHERNTSVHWEYPSSAGDRETDRDGRGGDQGAGQTGSAVTISKNRGTACNLTSSTESFT